MTPAINILKKKKFSYRLHEYQHDPHIQNYGMEAAEKIGVAPEKVFKTLVVSDGHQLFVGIVPVNKQLDLKKMAKIIKSKKLDMADPKMVNNKTGYIMGGVSPLGQKTPLQTILDYSAEKLPTIYVSGGKRGLDIELSPTDLLMLLDHAQYGDIQH